MNLFQWLIALSLAGLPSAVLAQVTFLGPVPYRSIADSPFDLSGLGTTFFFEDFEDGVFDLPAGVTSWPTLIKSPDTTTDSVDADDGVIDGWGTAGYTLRPNTGIVLPTGTPTWYQQFQLTFNPDVLGFAVNAFGFTWTDGVPNSRLLIAVRDFNGRWTSRQFGPLMDSENNGDTTEDVFFGVRSNTPIASVRVSNIYQSLVFIDQFEMDHVQYGLQPVPEPGQLVLAAIAASWLVASRVFRRRDRVRTCVIGKEYHNVCKSMFGSTREGGGGVNPGFVLVAYH